MKTSFVRSPMFRVTLCLSCLSAVGEIGLAQQAPPGYYPPRKPSLLQRIEQTGENVGSFIRRKFYGEPAPGAYQQPVYRRPGGAPAAYRAPAYNLDAPARPAYQTSGTGYQRPVASTTPKYVKPPRETSTEDATPETKPVAKTTSKTTTKPKTSTTTAKTKSTPPSEPEAAPKTTTKKRYTPAKPSTFAKPEPKPAPVRKTVEDQPPETRSAPSFPASTPEPPRYNPSSTGTTQASLKTERTSLSGGLDSAPTTTTTALSPTIGGSEVDLTPKDTEPAETSSLPKVSTTSQPSGTGTTTDVGSKSSGSFLVGKKGSKPGRVVSPYAPFNELDVTGLPTGSLALDPTTQKVFEVP
jgi:hypothetical protein